MSTSVITSQSVNVSAEQSASRQALPEQNVEQGVQRTEDASVVSLQQSNVEKLSVIELAKQANQVKQEEEQSKENIEEAVESVASFVNSVNKNVDFLVDEDSGRTIIKVVDVKSQELIRQFPSDEIISMANRIKELQEQITSKTGLFLDENV